MSLSQDNSVQAEVPLVLAVALEILLMGLQTFLEMGTFIGYRGLPTMLSNAILE